MCKWYRHPDLKEVRDMLAAEYIAPTTMSERKVLRRELAARIRIAKKNCAALRQRNDPKTYMADYTRDALSFAAMVCQDKTWTNGGHLII